MDDEPVAADPPRRSLPRRLVRAGLVLVLVGILVVGGGGLFLQLRLAGNLRHVSGAFTGLTERPRQVAPDAVDILVLTTDDRASAPVTEDGVVAPSWAPGAAHADSLLLLHLDGNRRAASLVSIPLSTPLATTSGARPVGTLLPTGSPSGLVGGVERLTGVRIDHLTTLDWSGFERLADLAGGVEVPDPGATDGSRREVTGTQGLAYVGGGLGTGPGGNRREQYLVRAVLDASLHQELRKQPLTLFRLLDTLTRHLSVESGWSTSNQRSLVISLRNMRSYAIRYITMPADDATLWSAVRSDRVTAWIDEHPDDVLPFATG